MLLDREKINRRRKQLGIKTGKMPELLGLSRAAYWRKIQGKSEFKEREIIKLARILHMRIEDFFYSNSIF